MKSLLQKKQILIKYLKNYLNDFLNFSSSIKALKIDPSILPNPSPSNQSPQNPILYFLKNCKDNGTAHSEGCEALHFIIEMSSLQVN